MAPLFLQKISGLIGLQAYITICIILTNIQILKITNLNIINEQIAMGTLVFSSVLLTSNILTEFYGAKKTTKIILIACLNSVIFTIIISLTIWTPLPNINKINIQYQQVQSSMETIFIPNPKIIVASIIAYIISQISNIYTIWFMKKYWIKKNFWIRANVANILSIFLDNIIFSIINWYIFSHIILDWNTIIFTYVINASLTRIIINIINTPFFYITYISIRLKRNAKLQI